MRKTFLALSLVILLVILLAIGSGHSPNKVYAQGDGTPTPEATSGEPCNRTLNNLVALLKRDYQFIPEAKPEDADFCAKLEDEANTFAEKQITGATGEGVEGQSLGAFAYLDPGARQYVGTMPSGTTFTAIARNATPGSQMIYVTGDSFAVFVDFGFTSLRPSDAQKLPPLDTVEVKPYCSQGWCRNPGPPPTKSK